MRRPSPRSPLPALALACVLLAPTARAAPPPLAMTGLAGPVVTPREVDFSALPRATGPFTGEPEERREARFPAADSVLARIKRHPSSAPALSAATGNLTLDASAGGAQVFAPIVNNGFEGITQGPYIPSEPTVAAGPLNIFTAGNVNVTVTNKDGSSRVETDGATFFGVPPAEGAISDAQCYYDALRGRFVALCFTQGTAPNFSNFYLAISKTNDARGAWWLYKFDMTKDGSTATSNWSDYQALGVSEDKIAMTGQQFSFTGDLYKYQKIRIIDRAAAYSGAALSYVDFVNFSAPSGDFQDVFVTKAARNLTAGDNTIHCLCVRTNGGSNVTYRTVTGPPGAPVLSAGILVAVSAYSPPPDAVQKGSSALVATNDCRPTDFYVRDGVLVAAWHTGANIGGTVSALRLFRMRTSDRAVQIDETYGAASTYYYYPAVTVDSVGTMFLGFDRSSSTEYPSAYATGRRRSDSTLEPSALLKAGLTPTAQSRWGDFTGIDNDASLAGPGGTSAWYAGQWTKGTNTFGTWINKLTFSYGQVAGTVEDDCDGSAVSAGDRTPLAGVTITLMQGATTVATTQSDASGNWSFGYLESGLYDLVVTPPAGGAAVDAAPGTGATTQTRVSAGDLQLDLTNSQTSTQNHFWVAGPDPAPATASISPIAKTIGSPSFSLTVNGSSFSACAVVQLDGSPRATTWVSANQLTALIPSSDLLAPAVHAVTVVNPAPGGGTSGAQSFAVVASGDSTPPAVSLTSPAGGEAWAVGSTQDITWTATDDVGVVAVDLAYSTDGGATFPFAIATGLANTGSYAWSVPATPSGTVRVRATAFDAGYNVGADSSHADFAISGWLVTASAGAHGTITPSGVLGVADGATPSFTVSPDANYAVSDVLVNGSSVGAVTNYTFAPVHANQTIAASFAPIMHTLTVTTVGGGAVAKSPDQPSYAQGSSVSLTATPGAGWHFTGWSGDTSGLTNPLSVTMNTDLAITATFVQDTYTWNQTGSAAWTTSTNWTPERVAPATDDVLIFSGGVATTATGVPTQTIGQLVISGNTAVTLQAPAAATLTIAGGAGADLDLGAGSSILSNGTNALTLALGAGATGSIGGAITVSNAAHRLVALGTNALAFLGGSIMTVGPGSTGNVFGNGTGASALNSVVFQNGSVFSQVAGANPFGASQPSSVVTFQAGSLYRLDGAVTPAFSGRTYANFQHNVAASTAVSGGAAFSVDDVTVTLGNFTIGATGTGSLRGSISVSPGATLTIGPATGTPIFTLNGPAAQVITAGGTLNTTSVLTLELNNANGVTLATNATLGGQLKFTSGRVNTGANTLAITSAGSITGASSGTGWVAGTLRRNILAGTSTRVFDVGDAATYAPVTLAVNSAAATFDVVAKTQTPDHPSLALSLLDSSKSANRWWTLAAIGVPSFAGCNATFAFSPADLDGAANPLNFQVARWNGAWLPATVGTRTATSTQATGLTAFGDFALGEIAAYTLSVTIVGSGSVAKSPDQPTYAAGASVQLTPAPAAGWHFTGWSGDASGAANPLGVTMDGNKSITATFAPDTHTLTLATAGSGAVAKSPDQASYDHGTVVQLTATPDAGWNFVGWTGDASGFTNPLGVTMDADKSITANFAVNSYTLAVTGTGVGSVGKSPDQPLYDHGTVVELTATPGAGWAFTAWSGDTSATTNPLPLPMIANRTLVASFADTARPVVTVTAPNGAELLAPGSSETLTWTATDNAAVARVDLLLSRTGEAGPYDTLAAGLANTGSFGWTVTGPATTDAFFEAVARDSAGNAGSDASDAAFTVTAVAGVEDGPVTTLELSPVRPNPATGRARFEFALPEAANVRLSVMDLQGREVLLLADGAFEPGRHTASFASARAGQPLGPGLYFLRLTTPARSLVRRFVFVR